MHLTIRELRQSISPHLDRDFFKPCPGRVLNLIAAYSTAALHLLLTYEFLAGHLSLPIWLLSLVVAANLETFFFFFMHEVLHGGVFKSRAAISVSSFAAGIPFLCSPYVWRTWHVHHHRHTAEKTDTDRPYHPDFDTPPGRLERLHDYFKRLRYWRLQSYLIPWFVISGHHLLMLFQSLLRRGPLTLNPTRAVLETVGVYFLFFLPLATLDIRLSLLGVYLPLLLAHLICNCYILSNHFDHPLNTLNCPLENSTSVYLLRGLPWTHMGFGRHVEHHIYPHVTHNKLSQVRRLLLELYPEKYCERNVLTVLHSILSRNRPYEPIRDTAPP